jgi:hypothetical protein
LGGRCAGAQGSFGKSVQRGPDCVEDVGVKKLSAPPTVDVDAVDGELIVRLHGLGMLVACRRLLRIPADHVRGVAVQHRDRLPALGFQFPGVALPGVLYAGSFGLGDDRSFWHVRRADMVLRVECHSQAEFRRIVLQVPDPGELARRLRPIFGAYVPPQLV